MTPQLEKRRVAGVSFSSTDGGELDKGRLDAEEHTLSDHYLVGSGDTKSDYSFPVVSADKTLKRGNVESAWNLRGHGPNSLGSKLKKLGREFDSNPIPDDAYKFSKHAEIAKVDENRNVIVGVAMEPNTVDSQGDFERPETIQRLSEGYMEQLAAGDAQSGVMHASFPSQNTLSHVENRVLSQSETIGDTEYPSGTWQIGVKVRDETLQNLINSDTLSGFSIGGHVHETVHHEADALPDGVRMDDDVQDAAAEAGEPVREITDATIHEISLVDTPAVQGAQIQTAKADGELAKASDALTQSVEAATEYLVEERGHDREAARELAAFLNREKSASESATADDGTSWLTRAKRFFTRGKGSESAPGEHEQSDTTVGAEPPADADTDLQIDMDKDELKDLIGDVVDEKLDEQPDEQPDETDKAGDEPSDLDEVKAILEDLQAEVAADEEKAEDEGEDEADDIAEVKAMLKQMIDAQGVSQQADTSGGSAEKTWDSSPFAAGMGGSQ